MKKYCSIILLVSIFGCKKTDTNSFASYISKIGILSTPLTFDCAKHLPETDNKGVDSLALEKFKPINTWLIGRIFSEEKFVTIIYGFPADDALPIIYTYEINGKPIDTLSLYVSGCQGDQWGGSHSFTTIDQKKEVYLFDTLLTRKVDINNEPIENTDSVFVNQQTYKLNETGHFIKINQSTHFVSTNYK